jgi:hypothetical protein
VEEDERHARIVGVHRTVDPDRYALGVRVLDRVHLVAYLPLRLREPLVLFPQLLDRDRARSLHARGRLLVEDGLDLRVENGRRHGSRFYAGGVSRIGALNGP